MRAALTALVVSALIMTGAPTTQADSTHRRKTQIDAQVRELAGNLGDLSQQLGRAVLGLRNVEAQVARAQAELSEVRGRLAAAEARDRRLAADLATARLQEADTASHLTATRASVNATSTQVGQLARAAYQQGSLSEWTTVLNAESPGDLASRIQALQSTAQSQGALLQTLARQRADLAAAGATMRAHTAKVRQMKADQEGVVAQIRVLEASARAATQRLAALARTKTAAVARVQRERAAEQNRYDRAVAESKRLAGRIAAQRRAAEKRLADQRRRQSTHTGGGSASTPSGGSPSPSRRGFLWPVSGPITTYAGPRTNPVTGRPSCHAGIDVGAPTGTPIRAMSDGIVVATTVNAWDGNTTILAHGSGLTTWYAHQSRFGVSAGQRVSRGQVIGYVGSTGFATGPHLHFDIAINEIAYDPMGWFGGPRRTVASMCPNGPSPVL